jgi:hypothetical protein
MKGNVAELVDRRDVLCRSSNQKTATETRLAC